MNAVRANLESAATGLLFISESESPFHYFEAPASEALTDELFVKLAGKPAGTPVEQTDIGNFFRNMVKVYPDASEADKIMAGRFERLLSVIKEELTDISVYRVGTRQVDAFIAGKTQDGSLAGLQTRLIET